MVVERQDARLAQLKDVWTSGQAGVVLAQEQGVDPADAEFQRFYTKFVEKYIPAAQNPETMANFLPALFLNAWKKAQKKTTT